MIDTSKLVDALSKVVDLAHREATAQDELATAYAAAEKAQADINDIAEKLIAAAGTPAEADAIAAVAGALDPVAALNAQAQG
jgi:hypothetical protein